MAALAAHAVEVDGIAARVGSSVILKSDVIGEMRRAGAGPDRYAMVRGEMIERELMLKAAAAAKLQMQDWVVENRIREIVTRVFGGDMNRFKATLAKDRVTFPEWRQRLKDDMVVAAMRWQTIDKNVTANPADMRKEYEAHPERYVSDSRVTVSAILVGPGDADKKPEIEEALKTEPFGEGAKKYSSDARDLDAVCPVVPVVLQTADGHSMWLNTAALERFGIDQACAEKWGPAVVRVREDGTPTGYISEGPVFDIMKAIAYTREQMKDFLLWFQDFMLSMGFTGAYDAGYEVFNSEELAAFAELDAEGKLKMQITGGMMTADNSDAPEDDAERIAQTAEKLNSDHLRIIGAKGFSDGVVEAHTAWLKEEYAGQPGYTGVKRWSDHGKMVRLLKALAAHGLNIHVHTIGDGASGFMIDAIEEAQAATGNYDMRNALAHLHVVDPADRARIADNNIVACVGLMWTGAAGAAYRQELEYLGAERVANTYPGRSIIDCGGMVVNHSDYPVSPAVGVPLGVYMSVMRTMPTYPADSRRNFEGEGLSRMDALRGMTTNVAYMWHAEDRMGSLSIGKLANMAVFDKDFLEDDIEDIAWARCLATIVDGEQVYVIGSGGPVGPSMEDIIAAG